MTKLGIVRGAFLNRFEMQSFAPLAGQYDITAFGSLSPMHDDFPFPVVRLPSPMDVPDFPMKMPILNRLFVDAHYLLGLEGKLQGLDIVHTAETYYHYTQQCLNARKQGNVKAVVATVLENIPHNNEGIHGRKAFKARARRELDHIIALTHKTKQALLQEGASPRNITVIGHGIDSKRFKPDPDHMRKLGRSSKDLTIMFSGRLELYKGVMTILESAVKLLSDDSIANELHFVFVGQGTARKEMDRFIRLHKLEHAVRFVHASYDGMPAIYRDADILVAPSVATSTWQEQYCTVLLEAQSMALPIVTTKSGGIPENVGSCALFAAEQDADSLTAQIKRFITDSALRVYYGRNARERAIKVHDVHLIADKLDRVYRQVLDGVSR